MTTENIPIRDIRDGLWKALAAVAGLLLAMLIIGSGWVWQLSELKEVLSPKGAALVVSILASCSMALSGKPDVKPAPGKRLGSRGAATWAGVVLSTVSAASAAGVFWAMPIDMTW